MLQKNVSTGTAAMASFVPLSIPSPTIGRSDQRSRSCIHTKINCGDVETIRIE